MGGFMIIKFRSILIFSSILFILGSFSSFTYLQYDSVVVAEETKNEDEGQRRPPGGPPPEAKEAFVQVRVKEIPVVLLHLVEMRLRVIAGL